MVKQCACGQGHASEFDGLCKFCREGLVSRTVAKALGVKHSGDGLTLEQASKGSTKYPALAPYSPLDMSDNAFWKW